MGLPLQKTNSLMIVIKQMLTVLLLVVIQSVITVNVVAQAIQLRLAPATITIDGNLSEWGNELLYADKKNTFSYLISNDHNHFYLVIKTKDTVCQANILGSGVTFTISTDKPKNVQKIIYPLRGKEDPSEWLDLDKEQVAMKTVLAKYKRIGVQNFKNIKTEQLSTTNPYGIKVAIGYTEDGCMIYEEAIPLNLIYTNGLSEPSVYSLKVNGLVRKFFYVRKIQHYLYYDHGKTRLTEDAISRVIQHYGDNMRMGGPMIDGDYEEKLTAGSEIKGWFIMAQ